jgi:hypothetical protein
MSLEENVADWVQKDNEQQVCLQRLRAIREQKAGLQEAISSELDSRGLHNPIVRISDGKLALVDKRVVQSLTLKVVEDALMRCVQDESTVTRLMDCIKTHRSVSHHVELRRYYNKKT